MEIAKELKNHIMYSTPSSCMCDNEDCYLNDKGWCSADTFEQQNEQCEEMNVKNENELTKCKKI